MDIKTGKINDIIMNQLRSNNDERGSLMETFRVDELRNDLLPVMSYISYTKPGKYRGPHEHKEQTDIFSFPGPGVLKLYLCDNRPESQTFGNREWIEVGESNPVTVVVPPGVVHGYKCVSESSNAMVINYPDKLYKGFDKKEDVDEIRHEDIGDVFFKDFLDD